MTEIRFTGLRYGRAAMWLTALTAACGGDTGGTPVPVEPVPVEPVPIDDGAQPVVCRDGRCVFPERNPTCAPASAPPCITDRVRPPEARTEAPGDELSNATLAYVVSQLAVPEASEGRAAGFNLDRLDAGRGRGRESCEQSSADFVNVVEPEHIGVDNALSTLLPVIVGLLDRTCAGRPADCLSERFATAIAQGSTLLLMELSGVDSLVNDDEVALQFFRGALPAGQAPRLGKHNRLARAQRFIRGEALGPRVRGDIFRGRLRARVPSLPVDLPVGRTRLTLDVEEGEMRVDLAKDEGRRGQIGGGVSVAAVLAAVAPVVPRATISLIRGQLQSRADIRPCRDGAGCQSNSGEALADASVCSALSAGLSFGLVSARIVPAG